MRNFFDNLRYRISQWMSGRYGNDEFNRFLSIVAIILILISLFGRLFAPLYFVYFPAILIFAYSFVRTFSKNYRAREKEREFYLNIRNKIASFFRLQKRRWNERNTSVFYKCPSCKTVIRVPKGKGKIQITCPKCKTQFIKHT